MTFESMLSGRRLTGMLSPVREELSTFIGPRTPALKPQSPSGCPPSPPEPHRSARQTAMYKKFSPGPEAESSWQSSPWSCWTCSPGSRWTGQLPPPPTPEQSQCSGCHKPTQIDNLSRLSKMGLISPRGEYFYLSRSQRLLHNFSFLRAVIFKSGVSCRNIGQEQFRVTQSCGAAWI